MKARLICLVRRHQWHNGWDEERHLTRWTCKRCGKKKSDEMGDPGIMDPGGVLLGYKERCAHQQAADLSSSRLTARLCFAAHDGYRPRCNRSASSSSAITAGGSCPMRAPRRRTARDRTCSTQALDERANPVVPG